MVIKLTGTVSADGAVVLSRGSTAAVKNPKWGGGGVLLSVSVVASADTSTSFVIADSTGTVFTIGSTDFTTRTNYKSNNAAIVRDGVIGPLTATVAGIASGTVTVDAWVAV